jgi:hypothetical protein
MKAEKEPECRDLAMFRLFSQAGNPIVTKAALLLQQPDNTGAA